jgi:hypothetical protein
MTLLHYLHMPTIAVYFLGACIFGICVLQKPLHISQNRRRGITAFTAVTLVAYIIEVLYYFTRSIADADYEPPKPAAIRCLGFILVWSPLLHQVSSSKTIRWHPYFGAFVLQFAFETTICLVNAFTISLNEKQKDVAFVINCVRAFASVVLMVDAFAILITKHVEKSTDEERQPLLNPHDSNVSDDDERSEHTDRDEEIKEQQAKRLEEEGGWLGYMKAFAIFLPYLFPKDDWNVMGALFFRLLFMIQVRVFNLLTPRQLGIITDKLSEPNPSMPWNDIGLWVFYNYIGSYAGFGILDNIANLVITNSAHRRITLLAYEHVLELSMDFHTSKDSGEVLKAVDQASSLNSLIEMVLFDVCPILLDIVVAMYYVTSLFDAYMAFIILFMGAVYFSIGWYFTGLSQPKRREYVEQQRKESSTVNETVHNWQTVAYFNRLAFECHAHNRCRKCLPFPPHGWLRGSRYYHYLWLSRMLCIWHGSDRFRAEELGQFGHPDHVLAHPYITARSPFNKLQTHIKLPDQRRASPPTT